MACELRVCGGGGWGNEPLLAVLHWNPSSLPYATWTSRHPAGRRCTPRSAAAFRHLLPQGHLHWLVLRHGHLAAFLVMRMLTAQTGGAPFSSARCVAAVVVPSSSVQMGLGLGLWLGLDVVAKLRGLLCSCFFNTSAHVRTAPWDPGGYTCAIIAFRRCPPSIEEAVKIKSPIYFRSRIIK